MHRWGQLDWWSIRSSPPLTCCKHLTIWAMFVCCKVIIGSGPWKPGPDFYSHQREARSAQSRLTPWHMHTHTYTLNGALSLLAAKSLCDWVQVWMESMNSRIDVKCSLSGQLKYLLQCCWHLFHTRTFNTAAENLKKIHHQLLLFPFAFYRFLLASCLSLC